MAPKGHYISYIIILLPVLTVIHTLSWPIRDETKRSLDYIRDSLLNFTELASQYGYAAEEHQVVTEDGYILTLFRIMRGKNCAGKNLSPPVLLMHGLLQCADSWLVAGPDAGLGYLIADACFDLWVGNSRGNYYSRKHVFLDANRDAKFWDFYIEQIGVYDVPAILDYVINHTRVDKVNYVGFSEGSGTYFVMCSERPGYCDKANIMIALAPATRLLHTKSMLYRWTLQTMAKVDRMLRKTSTGEMLSKGSLVQKFLMLFCPINSVTGQVCDTVNSLIDSYHPGSIKNNTTRILYRHFPAGTSLRNLAKYGQSMTQGDFYKFDYGKDKNLRVYGSEFPPKYNLSAVSVPVVTVYGRNDGLVDVKDVKWMMRKLPNVVDALEVTDPLWNHLDVSYSQYVSEFLFPKIYEHLISNSR